MQDMIILPKENDEENFREYMQAFIRDYKLKGKFIYDIGTKGSIILTMDKYVIMCEDFKQALSFCKGMELGFIYESKSQDR